MTGRAIQESPQQKKKSGDFPAFLASLSKNLFLTPLAEVTKAVKTSNSHSSAYRWYGRVGVAQ